MPLPQQVINQLTRDDSTSTPGWSSGVLLFSGAIFIVTLAIYFGMKMVYEPRLNAQVSNLQSNVATLGQSISSSDQTKLITFYSQISNLKALLQRHILFSQFFAWFEKNTEANIYYSQFSFSSGGSGGQVIFTGNATSEEAINQQIAIFESSPQVQQVVVTNVGSQGPAGVFQFTATLILNPGVITSS